MPGSDTEVVIVGGGAAGIAAGRRLADAGIDCLLVEARPRLGGRAWTVSDGAAFPLDLGCGWLHSADRNPWTRDRPGARPRDRHDAAALAAPFAADRVSAVRAGEVPAKRLQTSIDRLGCAGRGRAGPFGRGVSRAARPLERPDQRGQHLCERGRARPGIGAGFRSLRRQRRELAGCRRLRDGDRRAWRQRAARARLSGAADRSQRAAIASGDGGRHRSRRMRPSSRSRAACWRRSSLASPRRCPRKPRPRPACRSGSPTSCFCRLSDADEFDKDSRLFGRTDRSGTGVYHFRPFGRPQIEAYFGGTLAARARGRRRGRVLRFRRRRAGRPARQRFRPPGRSRCICILGASIRSPAARTPTRCRARPTAAPCSPRRWTIACSSPARLARRAIFPPRMAPISPASPPPTRRSPPGAADAMT